MSAAARAPQPALPASFPEALREGWRLIDEESLASGNFRCGTAILGKNGVEVRCFYFADREGFHFGPLVSGRRPHGGAE